VSYARDGEAVLVTAAAGEDWDALVARTVADGLGGLEALSGIPGRVGATPIQNVGAYGSDVAQTVTAVRALDRRTGEVQVLSAQQCAFTYRHSAFKADPTRWVVLDVTYRLGVVVPVRYAELARALGVEVGDPAPADQVRETVLRLRRGKGMVVDPADPDSRSVGSFFTNPVLAPEALAALTARVGEVPGWADQDGRTKVSAAWLIERAGFAKGWGDGAVGLSRKHVLAVVHRGGGSTAELLAVARAVRDGVRDATGVELVNEPVLVGVEL
jgi:UDP-N-acetylmuramate dehydrogenase